MDQIKRSKEFEKMLRNIGKLHVEICKAVSSVHKNPTVGDSFKSAILEMLTFNAAAYDFLIQQLTDELSQNFEGQTLFEC